MIETAAQAAEILRARFTLSEEILYLRTGGVCLAIRSNSDAFIAKLKRYFAHVASDDECRADVTIEAYDSDVLDLQLDWRDWAREPGKKGRKDAYIDLADGRLLLKVRTGMLFLQSQHALIARGPCSRLDNQVINFINSQYMNWLQQHGWLICHASCLDVAGRGIAMAGLSGGGKSTLMLEMMDSTDVKYVTNDRLFVHRERERVEAAGIPKLPRINPGTIVHNPALHGMIDAERRKQLLGLPRQELWDLEEKHDVMIAEIYGEGRITEQTTLESFLVLNWSHDAQQPTLLREVELAARTDLLPAIMKPPGPFYQLADGSPYQDQDSMQPEEQPYLDTLEGVKMLEACGKVDIPALKAQLYERLHRAT